MQYVPLQQDGKQFILKKIRGLIPDRQRHGQEIVTESQEHESTTAKNEARQAELGRHLETPDALC